MHASQPGVCVTTRTTRRLKPHSLRFQVCQTHDGGDNTLCTMNVADTSIHGAFVCPTLGLLRVDRDLLFTLFQVTTDTACFATYRADVAAKVDNTKKRSCAAEVCKKYPPTHTHTHTRAREVKAGHRHTFTHTHTLSLSLSHTHVPVSQLVCNLARDAH